MVPLPVVSCDGCGACCMHVGTPPDFLFDYEMAEAAKISGPPFSRWPLSRWGLSLPPDALASFLARVELNHQRGADILMGHINEPCCWLDPDTRRCRHYDHRPEICREFKVGGAGCLSRRRDMGIDTTPAS